MIYLYCIEEIIMPSLFFRIERLARFLTGGLALLTVVFLMLFKAQFIQSQPTFDAYGWYTVTRVDPDRTVTRRADDEASCRVRSRLAGVSCIQGKSLNAERFAQSGMH